MAPIVGLEPTLFVRGGALGDFVLTMPVLAALLRRGPVDVACNPRFLPLVRLCGQPGRSYDIEGPDSLWMFGGVPPVAYAQAVLFSEARAAELRIADVRAVASRPPPGVPATEHFCSVVPCDPAWIASATPSRADEPVVLAPGASDPARTRPVAEWLRLRDRLSESQPRPVVLVGGPLEPWAELRPDLPGLIALAASAALWIGPDTGPTHLAARLGRPTIALFGPSDPAVWAPAGARVLELRAGLDGVCETALALLAGRAPSSGGVHFTRR